MANHCVAAALLMVVSLFVAVALSGADARPTVRPNKAAAAALRGSNTRLTVRHDAHGRGYMAYVAAPAVPDPAELTDSKCHDDDEDPEHHGSEQPQHHHHGSEQSGEDTEHHHPEQPGHDTEQPGDDTQQPVDPGTDSEELKEPELDPELCSNCEEPKKPEPTCNTCEPEPELTCYKVHAVQAGETCDSVGQCAGLGQDGFLRFNPNICCDNLFVGQWVCLDATCA